jgi:hypothetical protein
MKFSEINAIEISDEEKQVLYQIEFDLIRVQMNRIIEIKQVIPLIFPEDKDGHEYEAIIDAWLILNQAELNRIENINSRYNAIRIDDPGMPAFHSIYPDKPNSAYFFEKEIFEMSEVNAELALIEIEAKHAEIMQARQEELETQQMIDSGKVDREKCTRVLDYISAYNTNLNLSIEQITQMQTNFADAELALRSGRPTLASMFINTIQPDGVVITENLKNKVLSLLM